MNVWRRVAEIEITDIIETDDRYVTVIVKSTGKVAYLPRFITDFKPGLAIVPEWLAAKICPAPAGADHRADTPDAESGAG